MLRLLLVKCFGSDVLPNLHTVLIGTETRACI